MKELFFYKEFNTSLNKDLYIFKIDFNIPDNINLLHNFGKIPDEFHISVLYRTITDLFVTNYAVKFENELCSFDDINEIKFISDLDNNENFDIFIPQIIEKINTIIESDF